MIAGIAKREITPSAPCHLMGYAARWGKPAHEGVHDPIYATALYLKDEAFSFLLLSLDLCELRVADADALRETILRETGVSQAAIAVTHTHSAPLSFDEIGNPGAFDAEWFRFALREAAAAAREATASPFEAFVAAGGVDAPDAAKNRRRGKSAIDPRLTVVRVSDASGRARAALVHYTCHATVLDGNSFLVSSDYPGYLRAQLAKSWPGMELLFLNGAAGDINIGYSADDSALGKAMGFRSFEKAAEIGRYLAEKADSALRALPRGEAGGLSFTARAVAYPLRDFPAGETLRAEERALRDKIAKAGGECREDSIRLIYNLCLQGVVAAVGRGASVPSEIRLLRLPGACLLFLPLELFCELGMEIKGLLPPGENMVVGYADGYLGYLPTAESFAEGGYEAETSPFTSETPAVLLRAVKDAL